jgi:hypothetical protein
MVQMYHRSFVGSIFCLTIRRKECFPCWVAYSANTKTRTLALARQKKLKIGINSSNFHCDLYHLLFFSAIDLFNRHPLAGMWMQVSHIREGFSDQNLYVVTTMLQLVHQSHSVARIHLHYQRQSAIIKDL